MEQNRPQLDITAIQRGLQRMAEQWTIALNQVAINMTRGVRDWHSPLDVGDNERRVLCNHCSNGWTGKTVEWPCSEYTRLDADVKRLSRDEPEA